MRSAQPDWTSLPDSLLCLIYSQPPLADYDESSSKPNWTPQHRLTGEMVCTSWARALQALPFQPVATTRVLGGQLQWLQLRRPSARKLVVTNARYCASEVASSISLVSLSSHEVLHGLKWESTDTVGIALIPAYHPWRPHVLQHLRTLSLTLVADETVPQWLPHLRHLAQLEVKWASGSELHKASLQLLLPPALQHLAIEAPHRKLCLDLQPCGQTLEQLGAQGKAVQLLTSGQLERLTCLELGGAAEGQRAVAQSPAITFDRQHFAALRKLHLHGRCGAVSLAQLPNLQEVSVTTAGRDPQQAAFLCASCAIPSLTRLVFHGPVLPLDLHHLPVLGQLTALQEMAVEAALGSGSVAINLDCLPSLCSLHVADVDGLQLLTSHNPAALTALSCHTRGQMLVDFARLPALSSLSVPFWSDQLPEQLTRVTNLECPMSTTLSPDCWASLRELTLWVEHTGEAALPEGLRSVTALTALGFRAAQGHTALLAARDLELLSILPQLKELRPNNCCAIRLETGHWQACFPWLRIS